MQALGTLSVSHRPISLPNVRAVIAEPSGEPAPMGQKTKYNDSFFDKMFMGIFTTKMEEVTGKKTELDGYEGLVEISRKVMQGRTPLQQRAAVRQVLMSTLPPGAPEQNLKNTLDLANMDRQKLLQDSADYAEFLSFRKLFPPTKWSAEFNAFITIPVFKWLVGPCDLQDVEVNGVMQKSLVKIKKCRYLENSGCVGMCVNMCKLPTQDFFTKEFGLPLSMTPNFEDMSCEMVFGKMPAPLDEDPAFQQPCFEAICTMAQPKSPVCPKLKPATESVQTDSVLA
ncbi:hypothetical protein AXG93_3457s1220 [Marchantia polymorpha subsp. ruderalis]|uniref:Beta-carotene isomerase D27-like C-terminal domain-containing protein n=1 Tax=Marchantia polymorpha subsp. ruderalis TaxID=1480154 RepID=A0A176W1W2_MARPO|nr:hypothetical protein AXG93_3457s1220 [Marchantia polymorpha subsp. ruderalis]